MVAWWGRSGGAGRDARRTWPGCSPAWPWSPLDETLGRQAGVLLGAAGTGDVIDAAVVLLAVDGDIICTSDPADLTALAEASGTHLELVPV